MNKKYQHLPHLFNQTDVNKIILRIEKLTPDMMAHWGKMTVSQMLTHTAETFEVALNKKSAKRTKLSYIIGPLFRWVFLNEKPLAKHAPTGKEFKIEHSPNFEKEKERLIKLINEFYNGGEKIVTKEAHAFFGKLTPREWARGMHKHTHHHLSQFGV